MHGQIAHEQALTGGELQTPLRIVRLAQGRSQRSVAVAAGIPPAQLSRAERGLGGLSIESLYRVAVVLHMDELARQVRPYVRPEVRREVEQARRARAHRAA